MPNYTKLFNSIVTSTIWTEDDKTRILWITMLALADQNGEVHASIPGLARLAGIDMDSTEKAIECFLSPDPYSRTPDNEGRRIAKIDGGWELLNHAKYRKMASKEDSKAATAERVRRHRERNAPVTLCNEPVTVSRDIAEADTKAEAEINIPPNPQGGINRRKKKNPKTARIPANSPTMIRINKWFDRRPDTLWTIAEADALESADPSEAELNGMEAFYVADEDPSDPLFRRTAIITLLNNWPSELDKARNYARKQRATQ